MIKQKYSRRLYITKEINRHITKEILIIKLSQNLKWQGDIYIRPAQKDHHSKQERNERDINYQSILAFNAKSLDLVGANHPKTIVILHPIPGPRFNSRKWLLPRPTRMISSGPVKTISLIFSRAPIQECESRARGSKMIMIHHATQMHVSQAQHKRRYVYLWSMDSVG